MSKPIFRIGDFVKNFLEDEVMITDILYDNDAVVYECNDGNLYYEEDLK